MGIVKEVVIIGGGLAGLTAALHLQQLDFQVTLIEKSAYPHHRVCGEYVSNEVLPYLHELGISFLELGPSQLTELQVTAVNGKSIRARLPLGGFGLSRYAMDNFLYQELISRKVNVLQDTVTDVGYQNGIFKVSTSSGQTFDSVYVLGAFGKRSTLDGKLGRGFLGKKSDFIAVKAHYLGRVEDQLVGLHNFDGGYCGISKVEGGMINVCYLADYKSFGKYKKIQDFQIGVLYKNLHIREVLDNSTMLFKAPMSIGQVCFSAKPPVYGHMLMVGDTAGLIHPLCGNGMAMAIHSAKIASELIADHASGKIGSSAQLEGNYAKMWKHHFGSRIAAGRMLSAVMGNHLAQGIVINTMAKIPNLLDRVISLTHGKPITIDRR